MAPADCTFSILTAAVKQGPGRMSEQTAATCHTRNKHVTT